MATSSVDMSFVNLTQDGKPGQKNGNAPFKEERVVIHTPTASSSSSPSMPSTSFQETAQKTNEVFKLTKEAWADVQNNPSWSNRIQFGIAIIFIVIWELLKALWQLGAQQLMGKATLENVEKK